MEYTICSESMPYGGSNSFIKSRFYVLKLASSKDFMEALDSCASQDKILES